MNYFYDVFIFFQWLKLQEVLRGANPNKKINLFQFNVNNKIIIQNM